MSKNEEKKTHLKEEFEKIQENNKDFDVSKYLAKMEDLPELGEIEIYDYNKDIKEVKEQSDNILESLVDLYLGDSPVVKKHPYIANKMKEDANIYAETLFLQKMTRKNFLTQLRQVDNGDNSARIHEVINQSISQIRENIKFSQSQRTELEKFWKEMRKDLGLNEISEQNEINIIEEDLDDGGKTIDIRKMNDMIENYIKNK